MFFFMKMRPAKLALVLSAFAVLTPLLFGGGFCEAVADDGKVGGDSGEDDAPTLRNRTNIVAGKICLFF